MKSRLDKVFLGIFAATSIVIVFFITVFIFTEGIPIFKSTSLWAFLTGKEWYPSSSPPSFGILPMIVGTLLTTLIGSIICIPVGLAIAIYLSEFASIKERDFFKPFIEIIAALPSVVIGFIGMSVVAPFMLDYLNADTGLNLLNASILLGLMGIPIVATLSEDALKMVPQDYRLSSIALGASRWETARKIVIPAALPGIMKAIMLAIGRLIGETMIVLMASGNSAIIPESLLDPVKSMAATIAAEMGETPYGSPHYHALFAIGMVLFVITFIINTLSYTFTIKGEERR